MAGAILLVDDEVGLVEVLRYALELSMPSVPVLVATSAAQAQALVRDLAPDGLALVCVDQRLGDATGLELLAALRARWPRVPALVYTGQTSPRLEEGARAIGAEVLTKPLRLAEWLGAVRRGLGP